MAVSLSLEMYRSRNSASTNYYSICLKYKSKRRMRIEMVRIKLMIDRDGSGTNVLHRSILSDVFTGK